MSQPAKSNFTAEAGPRPLYEIVDGAVVWSGTKYQRLAWESHAKEIWLLGGQRGGKTSSGAKWIVDEMTRCGPYGNAAYYTVVAPTLRICMDGYGKAIRDLYVDQLKFFIFNGREYEFRTTGLGEQALFGHKQAVPTILKMVYAENPRNFAAGTWVAAASDELSMPEFPREAHQQIGTRMMTFSGRVAPNNPAAMKGVKMGRSINCSTVWSMNWVKALYDDYAKVHAAAERAMESRCAAMNETGAAMVRKSFWKKSRLGLVHPDLTFIRFPSFANPMVDPEWVEKCRRTWPDWMFRQRILAEFTKPAGVIFEGWDTAGHTVEPFYIPSAWKKMWSIDFGSKNFYALLWAFDEERRRAFIMASYHRSDLSYADHARQLHAFCETVHNVAGNKGEESQRAQLASGGLPATGPAYHDFWMGTNDLAAAIAQGRVKMFRPMPLEQLPEKLRSLFPARLPVGFTIGAAGLANELTVYSRPCDPNTGDVIADAKPIFHDTFHWVDSARYFAATSFNGFARGQTGSVAGLDEPLAAETAPRRRAMQVPAFMGQGSMSTPGKIRAQRYGADAACYEPPVESFF